MIKKQCQQFSIIDEFISIDESMVSYRGLHSTRKFIKNKPIRFGYKVWMLCGSTGFPYNFAIYSGKESDREGPLRSCVCQKNANKASHVVFFDKLFTNYQLLSDLQSKPFERVLQLEKTAVDIVLSRQIKRCKSRKEELMISDQMEPCFV